MKLAIILLIFYAGVIPSSAQPSIHWKKALGSSGDDKPGLVQATSDGGYIVVGNGAMNGGNITGTHGSGDIWVAKLDATGNLVWQKALGGTGVEEGRGIRQTPDGGYIVIGNTNTPNDGDVSGMHIFNNAADVWVVKISSTGVIEWQHCYGGTDNDYGYSVSLTTDGGYLFGAQTRSSDGDMTSNPFNADRAWLIKTSNTGVIQWQSSTGVAYMNYVEPTADGGYIAACYANGITPGGDVNCGLGNYDILLVKFSNTGVIQWQKCLGGSGQDFPGSVGQTADGGYIVGGYTGSTDGDVVGQHGQTDAWIAKLSSTGVIEWQRCLGGTGNDFGFCARQTSDGGYVMAAELASSDGDVTAFNGGFWVIKMNATGTLQWQKNFGAPFLQFGEERPRWIEQTSDGGYIVDGTVHFSGGDVIGVNGGIDYWVVKLLCAGAPGSCNGTLPVDYSYFTGEKSGEEVVLKWKVENQFNNQRFEIERSNGQVFNKIGELSATIDLVEKYQWIDKTPAKGKNLYRIRQVDLDGRSKLSTTLLIDFYIEGMVIYPNPVKDKLFVYGLQEYRVGIIKDMAGRIISRKAITPGQQWVETGRLSRGIYILELGNQETRNTLRFVKE